MAMKAAHVPAGSRARSPAAEDSTAFSVFEGLALAGVTPRMVAEFCAAEPAEVEAWRKGRAQAPLGRVVFLTLLLSHLVDELVRTYDQWGPAPKAWHLHMQACLENTQAILARQHEENEGAPAGAFRQGEKFFEDWRTLDAAKGWSAESASRVALGGDTTGLALDGQDT